MRAVIYACLALGAIVGNSLSVLVIAFQLAACSTRSLGYGHQHLSASACLLRGIDGRLVLRRSGRPCVRVEAASYSYAQPVLHQSGSTHISAQA